MGGFCFVLFCFVLFSGLFSGSGGILRFGELVIDWIGFDSIRLNFVDVVDGGGVVLLVLSMQSIC